MAEIFVFDKACSKEPLSVKDGLPSNPISTSPLLPGPNSNDCNGIKNGIDLFAQSVSNGFWGDLGQLKKNKFKKKNFVKKSLNS